MLVFCYETVLRRQCVTFPHTRLASTVVAIETRRPTNSPRAKQTSTDGLPAFYHHFAPSQLPRSEPAKRIKGIGLKQHLQTIARDRERRSGASNLDDHGQDVVEVSRGSGRPRKKDLLAVGSERSSTGKYAVAAEVVKKSRKSAKAAVSKSATEETDVLPRRKRASRKEDATIAPSLRKTGAPAPVTKTANKAGLLISASHEAPRRRGRPTKLKAIPRVAFRSNQSKHHDLTSFLAYSSARNASTSSTVYRGTFYEYTVRAALEGYHFDLHRTGKSNDLGIDLLGQWSLPQQSQELKILVQCKLSAALPCNVRELEGAYVGAPAGWSGDGVMAFLVSSRPATQGVRSALQRSRLPMGFLQITAEGSVQQFIWNAVAQEARLTGMSTTNAYVPGSAKSTSNMPQGKIALVYDGRPL